MAKHKRLSKDQQRKAKLARRASRADSNRSSLAYTGNKYKADQYLPVVFRTELGIHEADVITGKELTDAQVRAALEKLVRQMRAGTLPALGDKGEARFTAGQEEDLIAWNIRSNWELLVAEEGHERPSQGTLIGILRTLLGSMEVWGSPGRHSRGYLTFLEGFMRKTGARVQRFTEDMEPEDEPPEDELLALGREWCLDGDETLGKEFQEMAERRIRGGEAESVVEAAQTLLGEFGAGRGDGITEPLSLLSLRAQESIRKRLT